MSRVDELTDLEFANLAPCRGCGRKPLLSISVCGFVFLCATPGCRKHSTTREAALVEWNRREADRGSYEGRYRSERRNIYAAL